ncbi:MAG: hypothetical protein J6K53_05620 [Roseburia sp.]|nr:hypothetical protein [Roseburia sp.]
MERKRRVYWQGETGRNRAIILTPPRKKVMIQSVHVWGPFEEVDASNVKEYMDGK